jgi:chromosome segregation ATPase
MEDHLSYSERMKERTRIISEIDAVKIEITKWDDRINEIKVEIEEFKRKIQNLEEELSTCKSEKETLIEKFTELKEKYIRDGIPVLENERYEIENGLLGMKRDINLKIAEYLTDDKVRQV